MKTFTRRYNVAAAVIIILITLVMITHYSILEMNTRNGILDKSVDTLNDLSEEVYGSVVAAKQTIVDLSRYIANSTNAEQELDYLKQAHKNNNYFSSMFFVDQSGEMTVHGDRGNEEYKLSEWYQKVLKYESVIYTNVHVNEHGNALIITIATPIYGFNGSLIGVVGGDIPVSNLISPAMEAKVTENSVIFIVDHTSRVIAKQGESAIKFVQMPKMNVYLDTLKYEQVKNERTPQEVIISGQNGYLAVRRITNINWRIFTFIPGQDYSRWSERVIMMVLSILGSTIVLLTILSKLQKKFIIKPLVQLNEDIAKISLDDRLVYRLPQYERDPFSGTREVINELLSHSKVFFDDLNDKNTELKEINDALETNLVMNQFIAEISTEALSFDLSHLDDHLIQMFKRIAEYFSVDGCYLFLVDPEFHTFIYRLGWPMEPKDHNEIFEGPQDFKSYPWLKTLLLQKTINVILDSNPFVHDTITYNNKNKEISFVIQPLLNSNEITGFIRLDYRDDLRQFNDMDIHYIQILGFMVTDILQKSKYVKELIETREKERAANQSKSQFLANMSHEIRTPMNGVTGYLELIKHAQSKDEIDAYVNEAQLASSGLLRIIDDILDLAKIEAGKMTLIYSEDDLIEITREAVELYRFNANKKNVQLLFEPDPLIQFTVLVDAYRYKQIVYNLVSNAIKFTQQGQVVVSLTLLKQTPHEMTIQLKVNDSGVGIPDEHKHKIFEAFTQVDDSDTRVFGGTGLGLTIVTQLVHQMNGTITVHDSVFGGTEFVIEITFEVIKEILERQNDLSDDNWVQSMKNETAHLDNRENVNVLIVDDNLVNQVVVQKVLQANGIACSVASSGQEAIEAVLEHDYDVIFMDCQMPIMDGYQCTAAIRDMEKGKSIRIVAMTANAMQGDREKCIRAGMDDYLSKPLDYERMVNMIRIDLEKPI